MVSSAYVCDEINYSYITPSSMQLYNSRKITITFECKGITFLLPEIGTKEYPLASC
jgi:hypothetical protein